MNTHSTVKPDTQAHPLEAICRAIVAGNLDMLPESEFTDDEWISEAQSALDNEADYPGEPDNFTDFAEMLSRGLAYEKWDDIAYRVQFRRDGEYWADEHPFSDWYADEAPYWRARAAESYCPMGGVA